MAEPARTVILIRHADVDPPAAPPPDDPDLNAAGLERRMALVHVLADAGIAAILTSPAARSQQTAEIVAETLGITPQQVAGAHLDGGGQAAAVAIRDLPSAIAVVLVVAHSHTLKEIIKLLGGPRIDDVGGREFDRLFVLNGERLIRSRYGAPSLPS